MIHHPAYARWNLLAGLERLDSALHSTFRRRGACVRPEFAWKLWDRGTARGIVQDNDVQIHLAELLLMKIGVR